MDPGLRVCALAQIISQKRTLVEALTSRPDLDLIIPHHHTSHKPRRTAPAYVCVMVCSEQKNCGLNVSCLSSCHVSFKDRHPHVRAFFRVAVEGGQAHRSASAPAPAPAPAPALAPGWHLGHWHLERPLEKLTHAGPRTFSPEQSRHFPGPYMCRMAEWPNGRTTAAPTSSYCIVG